MNELFRLKRGRAHNYTKKRDAWQMRLRSKYKTDPGIPHPCKLTLIVYTSRMQDWDNAGAVAKMPLDALQRLGWLEDDGPKVISSFDVRQEKCPRADVGFRLEFEAA